MRYCGHFLIKAEGGAKNYKRESPLPLSRRPFTVVFVQQKGYPFRYYLGLPFSLLLCAIESVYGIHQCAIGNWEIGLSIFCDEEHI